MATKNQNPAPGILGESPQLPTPHVRNLLPHEKKGKGKGKEKEKKPPKGIKNPQHKRTQKK